MSDTLSLDAVPETMLWTLYHRAAEARRPDAVLADPQAVDLVHRLGFPFAERFGSANPLLAQAQALRVRCFDLELARVLRSHPNATVVALGAGLETQFSRVDNGRVHWLSVDLEASIAARRRLLVSGERDRTIAGSALDTDWMDEVDPAHGVVISAQGLLMYLEPEQVHDLIVSCARRFPGATLLCDVVPAWFSARTIAGMRNAAGYRPPPMPWGVDAAERANLARLPGVREVRELAPPRGRGPLFGVILPLLGTHVPRPLRYLMPWTILRLSLG